MVDAGGGTIDITAHQVMEDRNVRELIKATGGNWGGRRADEEYMDFIKCLIGETTTNELSKSASNVFFEASREFELIKRTINPNSDIKFSVRIPSQIGETYEKTHQGKDLKSVKSVSTKNEKTVNISIIGDKLRMASNDAEDFFAKSIDKITKHLKELFCHKNGRNISTIILVGGFAESEMLIEGIKSNFPKMRTIIPQEAHGLFFGVQSYLDTTPVLLDKDGADTRMVFIYSRSLTYQNMTRNISMKKMEKYALENFSVNCWRLMKS